MNFVCLQGKKGRLIWVIPEIMSSTIITIDIEVKPYLRKYLLYKSINKTFPLRFPNRHDYNHMLVKLVTNYNSLSSVPIADKENVMEYFKSSQLQNDNNVTIILPFNSRKDIRSYNYLSVKSKIRFRKEVRIDFNFEFSRDLFRGLKDGLPRTEIINLFKRKYNITEDDLKSESLYRFSTRMLQEL